MKHKRIEKTMVKNVLLINSPRVSIEELNNDTTKLKSHYEVYPPLGLMYLSSTLKEKSEDVNVEIFDLHFQSIKSVHETKNVDWKMMCSEKIKKFKPDLIGLSVMFGASIKFSLMIAHEIRQKYPTVVIVGGGVHMSAICQDSDLDALGDFDFVCLREAEFHFLNLVNYLNGKTNSLQGIKVINQNLLRDPADVVAGFEIKDDIDEIPMPDFDALDLRNYCQYGILSAAQTVTQGTPLATMLTERGCTARCTFCSVRSFNGPFVRAHSPERVLREFDYLYQKVGIRHIDLVDDDFTFDKERTLAIMDGLIQRNYDLTWSLGNGVRLGTLDDELLEKMEDAGCSYLSVGIESGDPEILKQMKKPLSIPLLREKAKVLQRHPRIYYRANFITGFPGETREQLQHTFDVAEEMQFDWCLFSILKVLPQTELYNKLLGNSECFSTISSSGDFSFSTPAGMAKEDKEEGQYVFDYSYENNLKINFMNNINLKGRNVQRAIKDFERIVKFVRDHAFAWNCLTIGYKKLGRMKESDAARRKTIKIVGESPFWRDYFEKLRFEIA